ncbi:MAG TPA: EVE domain-containing protein [Gemmatimonadaceae bacterium]|nr:EVE domain-containing protein [Gemmatimonadaceae bacterium]
MKKKADKRADIKGDKGKAPGAWDAVFTPRAPGERRYWLVKSEPSTFSFDDLLRIHNKTTHWNGIRNFVARNFMRDGMRVGDRVFFYHSSTEPPGVVGICEVVREAYADDSAFDPSNDGYDPKSTPDKPVWYMVDLRAVAQLTHPVTLEAIKQRKELANMALLRIGRLSVTPVTPKEWETICAMAS